MTPLGRAGRIPDGQSQSQLFTAEAPLGQWTVYTAVVGLVISNGRWLLAPPCFRLRLSLTHPIVLWILHLGQAV